MGNKTPSESIEDSDKWKEGDFTIISSDGVRFKAPSQVLFLYR